MTDNETHVSLGTVGRPFGVHGEIRIWLNNPRSNLVEETGSILARGPDGQTETWTPLAIRRTSDKKALIVRTQEISDRNTAEERVGWTVIFPREDLPTLEEDEFYFYELEGMEVKAADGQLLGHVLQVVETSVEVLVVELAAGGELLLPILDSVVQDIDREKRTIVVAQDAMERFAT